MRQVRLLNHALEYYSYFLWVSTLPQSSNAVTPLDKEAALQHLAPYMCKDCSSTSWEQDTHYPSFIVLRLFSPVSLPCFLWCPFMQLRYTLVSCPQFCSVHCRTSFGLTLKSVLFCFVFPSCLGYALASFSGQGWFHTSEWLRTSVSQDWGGS